jgi:hypothetical protein
MPRLLPYRGDATRIGGKWTGKEGVLIEDAPTTSEVISLVV